ncbi:MAG: hypothetical protein IKD04_03510 [Clostridia bacterium]|nr:hypothetical protein [Clostridia bacterium]
MNKKVVIIVAAVVLAVALVITGTVLILESSFGGSASGDPTITVGTVSGSKGDTVKVPVEISSNPGIMAFLLEFNYDKEALEYTGYKEGDFLTGYDVNATEGTVKFLNLEDNDVAKNGVLIYLEFKILDGAAAKNDIKLVIGENSICNYNEEVIEVTAKDGSVKVK